MTYAYNRLGEERFNKDQNGTKHIYTMDAGGRVTLDKIPSGGFGANIDSVINAIAYSFDSFGRTDLVRSYADHGGGGQAIKNALKFEYTDLWQLEKLWQQHDGDVVTSGGSASPKVTYAYGFSSNANKNYSRITGMTYPHASYELPYEYGASGASNDLISRIIRLDIHGSDNGAEYSYVGTGLVAMLDLAGAGGSLDVMLTRWHDHEGATSQGSYPGFDRFGRVQRHLWADGEFATTWLPAIVEIIHSYDKASNLLTALDAREAATRTNRDFKYIYDELDRLAEAKRGIDGGSFTHVSFNTNRTPSQRWTLDFLGNWKELFSDKDADGPDGDGTDNKEQRKHNDANEIFEIDANGDNTYELPLTHDKAGNVRERRITLIGSNGYTKQVYTHDGWGRLVKVQHVTKPDGQSENSPITIHEAQYNGLSWRTIKRADTSAPTVNGLDEMRVMIYSAGWQMLEERVDTGWSSGFTADKVYQTIYGIRYIDDVICRRIDATANGSYDESYYHLTDNQFSTVAVLTEEASLIERVMYDPYGRPLWQDRTDIVTGDGEYDPFSSEQAIYDAIDSGGGEQFIGDQYYSADLDVDRDGDVDWDDASALGGGDSVAFGHLSTVGNVFGFSGYIYNPELVTTGAIGTGACGGVYTVRFRHYDTSLGRWLERDPLGYVDGMSLYAYVAGTPLGASDPYGLVTLYKQTGDGRFWPITEEEARKIAASNGDVFVLEEHGGKRKARRVGDQWFGPKRVVHDPHSHNPNVHVQHKNGGRGHINVPGRGGRLKVGGGAAGILAFVNIRNARGDGIALGHDLLIHFYRLENASDASAARSIATDIFLRFLEEGILGYNTIDEIVDAWKEYRRWLREQSLPEKRSPSPSRRSVSDDPTSDDAVEDDGAPFDPCSP